MKVCKRMVVLLSSFVLAFVPANGQWANGMGGSVSDRASGIGVDASGNVYVTGTFNGTADFDPSGATSNLVSVGNSDVFIAKYNSSGSLVWAKSVGGSGIDVCYGIAVDGSSNVYIVGYFNGTADFDPAAGTSNLVTNGGTDIFLAKYSSAGALVWAKNIGGTSNDVGRAITLDGSENVYITGEYRTTADFNPGGTAKNLTSVGNGDVFIAEYSSAGSCLLAISVGGTSADAGYGIGVDGIGSVTITGEFNDIADFDPGTGTSNLTSAGATDIFLAQYDFSGNLLWYNSFGETSNDYSRGIAVDPNGGDIYITGVFNGTADFNPAIGTTNLTSAGLEDMFFAKYDASGGLVFAKSVGGSFSDLGAAITFDASGNVYVAGYFTGTDADFDPGAGTATLTDPGGFGLFYAKYNSSGIFQWVKGAGDVEDDEARAIAVDGSGNVYVTGFFGGTVDFDPGPGTSNLVAAGSDDIFLAKYESNGALPVELASLEISVSGNQVGIRWRTATETNNYGFEIERSEVNGQQSTRDWMKVGFEKGQGTSTSPHPYAYTDANALPGRYAYRIKQINADGSYKYTHEVEVDLASAPRAFALNQNYPNPFNPTTNIEFTVPEDGRVKLKVYNMLGEDVATLLDGTMTAGEYHRVSFDASHFAGGVYFARLQSGGKQLMKKMVLIK
jgi:hypothetical protein